MIECQLILNLLGSEKGLFLLKKFILREELVSGYSKLCGKNLRLDEFKSSFQVCIKSN